MHAFRFKITFRVRHPSVDPVRISEVLGLTPTRAWKAGDQRKTPKGRELEGLYPNTHWYSTISAGDDGHLSDALSKALNYLLTREEGLAALHDSGGTFEFFIGWFTDRNSGGVFTPDLLGRLSRLGIALALDVYGGPEEASSECGLAASAP